jgi:SAM-dependent methyltransferase
MMRSLARALYNALTGSRQREPVAAAARQQRYRSLLSADPPPPFPFIDPPFNFNSSTVSQYPAEVTGSLVLNSLCRRLGWTSLAGKRLLDLGCGVRFARTLVNLRMDVGFYAGVDVNAEAIAWLKANVRDARFRFERIDMCNPLFNPQGSALGPDTLRDLGLRDFDAACLFSVITHQDPEDATTILRMLARCVAPGGALYFTAFIDDTIDAFAEREPANPGAWCNYNPDFLIGLADAAGWTVKRIYPASVLHQPAFVCERKAEGAA